MDINISSYFMNCHYDDPTVPVQTDFLIFHICHPTKIDQSALLLFVFSHVLPSTPLNVLQMI